MFAAELTITRIKTIIRSKTIDRTPDDYNKEDSKSSNNYKAKILNFNSFK